jgi:protein-tyrosine phosphatase
MIDLHCHILPGLDDGPRSLEESLLMARTAVADGIESLVATPHCLEGLYPLSLKVLTAKVNELRAALGQALIPLRISPGAEVYLDAGLAAQWQRQQILTINQQKYFLLELPKVGCPTRIKEILFQLRLRGYRPIFTHLERHAAFQENTALLFDLVRQGALVQLTARSITGHFGTKPREASRRWLSLGLVHFIATDAHSHLERPPLLSLAVGEAAALVGRAMALKMVTTWPEKVLAGESLPEIDSPWPGSVSPPKRNFFFFFLP